jgi:hypothetical protein
MELKEYVDAKLSLNSMVATLGAAKYSAMSGFRVRLVYGLISQVSSMHASKGVWLRLERRTQNMGTCGAYPEAVIVGSRPDMAKDASFLNDRQKSDNRIFSDNQHKIHNYRSKTSNKSKSPPPAAVSSITSFA